MTKDVIHSTLYYIKHINRAILANLQCRTVKLGRLIVLQETHLWLQKIPFPLPVFKLSRTKYESVNYGTSNY